MREGMIEYCKCFFLPSNDMIYLYIYIKTLQLKIANFTWWALQPQQHRSSDQLPGSGDRSNHLCLPTAA